MVLLGQLKVKLDTSGLWLRQGLEVSLGWYGAGAAVFDGAFLVVDGLKSVRTVIPSILTGQSFQALSCLHEKGQ